MSNFTSYREGRNDDGDLIAIIGTVDGFDSVIPINSENRHYQEYLTWLAEGNEPLPADDPS